MTDTSTDGPVSRDEVRASDYPFDRIPFDHAHCFLCGTLVDEEGSTREHVFPKWLQRKFDLWNQQLSLLNGTLIPYRQLTIPCCVDCNTGPLSQMEDEVRSGVEGGYHSWKGLSDLRLFQWAGKLMFGILFKEISLEHDRKARTGDTILPPKSLDDFSTLHDLLQSIRVTTRFEGGPIFSVIALPLHRLDGLEFDFADSIVDNVVAIKMGNVGVIASLMDAGLANSFMEPIVKALDGTPLHPIQFDELLANVVYAKQRMTRTVKFVFSATKGDPTSMMVVRLPLAGLSLKPVLRDFDPEEFRPILRRYLSRWGSVTESVWNRADGVGTTVFSRPGHLAVCNAAFDLIEERPYKKQDDTAQDQV